MEQPPPESAPQPEIPSVFKTAIDGALAVLLPATSLTLRRKEEGLPLQKHQLQAALVFDVSANLSAFGPAFFSLFTEHPFSSLATIMAIPSIKGVSMALADSLFNPKN